MQREASIVVEIEALGPLVLKAQRGMSQIMIGPDHGCNEWYEVGRSRYAHLAAHPRTDIFADSIEQGAVQVISGFLSTTIRPPGGMVKNSTLAVAPGAAISRAGAVRLTVRFGFSAARSGLLCAASRGTSVGGGVLG